ncbi:hypothetical protein Glove_117g139 [Diversispora epigaea]|uniref:non-specific serine/threonine protein kinase n=1 Tax=Diversispora epigaea TaxID=1348612 RepID=A0A397J3X0_9GLOM|nr:hypothetical protein Glove_117g139 [Diversispora epigaea]
MFMKPLLKLLKKLSFLNIKRHRKLEIHDRFLNSMESRGKNINNYMIILEYVNEGSLRQYLKTNFQKLDWNTKLNLAKQIADVLMHLHANDIIHGKFAINSENIQIHNGIIKLNVFGLTKIISDSLSFLTNTNNLVPIQYMDPRHLELFKNKSSDIFGLGSIIWEISSGYPPFEMESSSKVDLFNNIVEGKKEIAIPGTPHKYEEIYTVNVFIKDLFELLNDLFNRQFREIRPIMIKNYIREYKKNPIEILSKMITSNSVASRYSNGFGVEKNEEKAFELYLKLAEKGFLLAQFNVDWCYKYGAGITKDETEGNQWVMKSARAENINAMGNIGYSHGNGIGMCKDKKEAFKWCLKAAEKEHNAPQYNIGLYYYYVRGINRDYKKAFE